MTLVTVRDAALDRALVGDDPESALILAGVADRAVRSTTDGEGRRRSASRPTARRHADDPSPTAEPSDPFAVAMLAVAGTALIGERHRALDDGAWQPGHDADPCVVAGAAVAVRERDVAVERAAELAGCASASLETVVERQCCEKER